MVYPKFYLSILLFLAHICNSFAFTEQKASSTYFNSYQYNQNQTLTSFSELKPSYRKKHPRTILKRKKQDKNKKREHPRKIFLEQEPINTQRTWLYSAVVPGLGQACNKHYWKIPVIYAIFAGLTWGAIYNHQEYTATRREYIDKHKDDKSPPKYSSPGNFIEGRKRDRTIFILSIGLWYLLNVFDAYVYGSLKTFDVSDDLEVIISLDKSKDKI